MIWWCWKLDACALSMPYTHSTNWSFTTRMFTNNLPGIFLPRILPSVWHHRDLTWETISNSYVTKHNSIHNIIKQGLLELLPYLTKSIFRLTIFSSKWLAKRQQSQPHSTPSSATIFETADDNFEGRLLSTRKNIFLLQNWFKINLYFAPGAARNLIKMKSSWFTFRITLKFEYLRRWRCFLELSQTIHCSIILCFVVNRRCCAQENESNVVHSGKRPCSCCKQLYTYDACNLS